MKTTMLALSATALSILLGCTPSPQIRTYIPWRSFEVNQDCVHKAIDATPGIEFIKEEEKYGGTCVVKVDCWRWHYTTYYRIKDSKTDASSFVQFTEYWDNSNALEDISKAASEKGFSPEDRASLLKAQADLNESILKSCRDAGKPYQPVEGR